MVNKIKLFFSSISKYVMITLSILVLILSYLFKRQVKKTKSLETDLSLSKGREEDARLDEQQKNVDKRISEEKSKQGNADKNKSAEDFWKNDK